jgi:HEAT repeat protein
MYHRSKGLSFEAALRDMTASSPRDRVTAAETLASAKSEEQRDLAFDALAAGVGDARPEVRTTACYSLAALELPAAWELIALCLTDTVPEVRQSAAIALGTLGAKPAFDSLAEALRDGPADLRFQAATSLVEVDSEAAYPLLIDALSDDEDSEVLGAVALSLGAIGKPESANAIAALLDHSASQTRLDAAYALAQLGDPRASQTLAAFLVDKDLGWDAVIALETLGQESLPHFQAFLDTSGGEDRVRIRAAGALLTLAATDHSAAQACLIAGLRSRKVELRGLALQELSKCAGDWAKPALVALHKSFRGRRMRDEIDAVLTTIDAA